MPWSGPWGIVQGEPDVEGPRATHHYRAEDVHDFAFAVDPDFQVATAQWEDVEIEYYHQPEHASIVERHLEVARQGLEFLDDFVGEYPYPTLTMIDPGPGARGASGMEYPTLFTVGVRTHSLSRRVYPWLVSHTWDETTLLHELAHQYSYGLIGSNEFEEAWLDEGFTSWFEEQASRESVFAFLGGSVVLSPEGLNRAGSLSYPNPGAFVRKAWEFAGGSSSGMGAYGAANYLRPPVVLGTLQNLLGRETMREAMRTYYERWRFRHPRTEDFTAVVEEVADQDLDWFWDQFVYDDRVVDYRVRYLRSRKGEADRRPLRPRRRARRGAAGGPEGRRGGERGRGVGDRRHPRSGPKRG